MQQERFDPASWPQGTEAAPTQASFGGAPGRGGACPHKVTFPSRVVLGPASRRGWGC